MKKKPKYNAFQGNEVLQKTVADALDFKGDTEYGSFTDYIFLSTYFYLSQRFGAPKFFDEYKQAGVWSFDVKNYTISVELNSSWVIFVVYGEKFPVHPFSPYQVRQRREWKRKRHLLIGQFTDKRTKKEIAIMTKLWKVFSKENKLDGDDYTDEMWEKDEVMKTKWYHCIQQYNKETIGIGNWKEWEEKHGEVRINADIRHAKRTLFQFIKNLTTPIYIRDVPYNIKGRMSDEEAEFARRYENNIKIEYKKPKK